MVYIKGTHWAAPPDTHQAKGNEVNTLNHPDRKGRRTPSPLFSHRHSSEGQTMRKHLGVIVLVFVFSGVGSEVIAQTLHYDNFADVSALRLNGSALTVGSGANTALRVAYPGAVSSAFTNTTFSTNVFSTRFDFRISDVGGVADSTGSVGGDGFTFCLQPVSPTDIGQGGGTLGYGNTGDPSAHAISPSFAVEFDTYMNGEFDPNSNHLGIDVNGNVSHPLALPTAFVAPPFDDGNTWHAWIDYYNNILEVRAANRVLDLSPRCSVTRLTFPQHWARPLPLSVLPEQRHQHTETTTS